MGKILNKKIYLFLSVVGIFTLLTLLSFYSLSINIKVSDFQYSIWKYATNLSHMSDANIYCFIVVIYAFLSIPILLLDAFFLFKKKRFGTLIEIIYHIIFAFLVFTFELLYNRSNGMLTTIALLNVILSITVFAFVFVINHDYSEEENIEFVEDNKPLTEKSINHISLSILILNILGFIAVLSTIFVPLYNTKTDGNIVLISSLFNQAKAVNSVLCLVDLIIIIISTIYLSYVVSLYRNKNEFIKESKSLMNLFIASTIIYFLMGFSMKFYEAINNREASTISFIPLVCIFVLSIIHSCKRGQVVVSSEDKSKIKHASVLPLILVLSIAVVTVLSLALNVVRIEITSDIYNYNVNLTGFKILSDYPTLAGAYQVIAFIIVIMLITTGIGVLFTLTTYFSKSTYFKPVARYSVALNLFFVLALSVSGLYFTIANKINEEAIEGLIGKYINFDKINYTYVIKTDLIYALALDIVFVIIVFGKKVLDKTEFNHITIEGTSTNEKTSTPELKESGVSINDEKEDFDACPAFYEMDSLIKDFKKDYDQRMKSLTNKNTLSSLVKYVVDYAKNSRLHLSYSREDIATFISGLGSTKLSILQGMSGTGKTSLPKIFSEAIFGNCEIIEVESSWKDKNELLGYYNEFSEKFTPKKFTQALYKASLNPEIVTFIVLDEMNLSRIEYYFSDFLSLMENEEGKRNIKLVNIKLNRSMNGTTYEYKGLINGHTLQVPSNVWFVGTANRDESTFVISDKVYDRAYTMNFNKRAPKVKDFDEPMKQEFFNYDLLNKMLTNAVSNGNFDAENNSIIKSVEKILQPYNISFGNRILNQIESFVKIYQACFENSDVTDEAIETILLSKVVSKLEVKIIDNKEKLMQEFDSLKLFKCKEFISSLNED